MVVSCSSLSPYLQVAKLTSDNVQMNNNGKFEYKQQNLTISYNFWNNGGNVRFIVTNSSDKDIYLLVDKCYFIENGFASDYYKNRTYVVRTTFGSSTETAEDKVVCIPPHSSKSFAEFSISETPYRQCGFARYSESTDGEKLCFSNAFESPKSIENRLVFKINGEDVPIVNKFYISEYINIHDGEGYAYVSDYSKDCNGNNKSYYKDVKYYKHAASNCFYTTYRCQYGVDDDRITKK